MSTTLYPRLGLSAPSGIVLPSGFLLAYTGPNNAGASGANAKLLSSAAGSAQQFTSLSGVSSLGSRGLGQFLSGPLTAQSIAATTWTVGFAVQTSVATGTSWEAAIILVNGATGINRMVIANANVGATGRTGTGEVTAYQAAIAGNAATASVGDYLAFDVAVLFSTTPTNATETLYADGTTAISSDNVGIASAQTFLTCAQTLGFILTGSASGEAGAHGLTSGRLIGAARGQAGAHGTAYGVAWDGQPRKGRVRVFTIPDRPWVRRDVGVSAVSAAIGRRVVDGGDE